MMCAAYVPPLLYFFLLLHVLGVTANNKDIQVDSGLNDATAVVGKLLLYTVQPSAFTGHVRSYQISDAADGPLPEWLYWDELRAQLFGVPALSDVGHVYVQVTAIGALNRTHTQSATDVFDIHVREETTTVLCARRPAVSIGLLLDANVTDMTAYERVGLMERAAKQLRASIDDLRLYSASYERDARQRELLMAGPGNVPLAPHTDGGAILLWPIGCGRTIDSEATKRIETLEKEAASGAVASKLGYGVTSWEVSTGKLTSRKLRRQLGARGISPSLGNFFSTEAPMIDVDTVEATTPAPTSSRPAIATSSETTEATTTPVEQEERLTDPTTVATTTTQKRTTRQTTWREEAVTTPLPPSSRRPDDKKPVVTSSIDTFTCERGVLCRLKIPERTFTDAEDGDTYKLKLSLHAIGDETNQDWLFLDKNQQHLLGLSLEPGMWDYRLEARDSSGQMASTAFAVKVTDEKDGKFNHYFRVVIEKPRHELLKETDGLVKFVRKLATSVSDDRHPSHITVRSLSGSTAGNGSTVIEFSNNTLPDDVCASGSINTFESVMVTKQGKVKNDFQRSMTFAYPVVSVEKVLEGNCVGDDQTTGEGGDVIPTKGSGESDPKEGNEERTKVSGKVLDDDLFLSTILPIAIIAVLLVVAIVVACCLYRRNRSYKLAATKEAKSDYVSKGMPVVFPEEVGGREEMATVTTPMLVKEERPPLVPPPFESTGDLKGRSPSAAPEQRATSVVSATTEHENPLYKPPPPIELSSTRSPRPKHSLPHQREPPPYVPP